MFLSKFRTNFLPPHSATLRMEAILSPETLEKTSNTLRRNTKGTVALILGPVLYKQECSDLSLQEEQRICSMLKIFCGSVC